MYLSSEAAQELLLQRSLLLLHVCRPQREGDILIKGVSCGAPGEDEVMINK